MVIGTLIGKSGTVQTIRVTTLFRENVAIEFPDSYEGCITSFCDPKLFQKKFAFNVLDHDNVWACFGCHPHHSNLYNAEVEAQLEILAKHPKVLK